jgi:hypothetical protein
MGRKRERNQTVCLAEQSSPSGERIQMRSTDFAVPVTAKVICAQGIDGYQNHRNALGCESGAGKDPQDTNEELSPKPPNSNNQNCSRKEKLITLEVEDPLK